MAPPNKKNAFMVFVNNWRLNYPHLSISQAVAQCSGTWEKMSALERKPFADCKVKPQKALSKADEAQLKEDEEEDLLKRSIERIVMEGKKFQDLEKTKFLFCAFNYFTKDPDADVYVPAEFAACEYSLKEGIISEFSTLINPGQLNLGLGRVALNHSRSTHNLPLPPKALGESNLTKLRSQMIKYLNKYHGHRPAFVFTTTEMRPIVQSCFRFLASNDKNNFLLNLMVVDIQYLFFVLKKGICDMAGLPSDKINIYITNAVFLKDFFEFTKDIACEFHEENDRIKYCTQSMVTRWAYTFSDYMCGDLGIAVVPGKHVPATVKPSYRVHNADTWSGRESSVESFYSLASFQGMRINEVKKGSPAISSRCSSAAFGEDKEFDRQDGSRRNEFSDAFLPTSSRSSIASIPHGAKGQKGSSSKDGEYPRQGGYCRNPSLDMQRGSHEEFPDEITEIICRRSGASIPYGATGQKDPSKVKEYHRNPSVNSQRSSLMEFPDEITEIICRRSGASKPYKATDRKDSSSKAEEYHHQGEYHRTPLVNIQRGSPKEFPDEISSIGIRRSGASIAYGAADLKKGSSKAKEYPRQDGYQRKPSLDMQRGSPEEFPDEITEIICRRSGASVPYGATDQKGSSKVKENHSNPSAKSQRSSLMEFPNEISSISSLRSSASIAYGSPDQKGSSKAEECHRKPSVNSKRSPFKESPDKISSINSRRSSVSVPYGATDRKDSSSKAEEYPRQVGYHRTPLVNIQRGSPKEFPDEISSIGSRRSGASNAYGATDLKKDSSKPKEDPRQGGYQRKPSLDMQRGSPEEFPDEISEIICRRSGASIAYGAKDQKSSSKAKEHPRQVEYHRNPSVNLQRRSPEEYPEEISPLSSPRSSPTVPYGATYQKGSSLKAEKYPSQGERQRTYRYDSDEWE